MVSERKAARPSTVDDPAAAPRIAPEPTAASVPASPIPAPRAPSEPIERMSRLAVVTVALVLVAAVSWLFMSWLVLDSPLGDAIGETAGSLALGLVVVSFVGALRRSRR